MKKLDIIYEDKNILVVNKEPKILTISSRNEKEHTLYHEVYNYLHKKNQKVFIVHRLDKDTSGLVLFAKNEKSKEILQNTWKEVERKYYAVVEGIITESDTIKSYLKETSTNLTFITKDEKNGKLAITNYMPIKQSNTYTLLDINILTGRKNQIRVQLKSINHPIIGDKKYGANKNPISRLGLHAYKLSFIHPITKEPLELIAPLPKEFDKIFN